MYLENGFMMLYVSKAPGEIINMSNKTGVLYALALLLIQSSSASTANEVAITKNGRVATLKIPLKAIITPDMITREIIDVIPLSSFYENATWNIDKKKFNDHQLLLRVTKNVQVPVLFEIINDQYTCSYNNPDWMAHQSQPTALIGANTGYTYTLFGGGNTISLTPPDRLAVIDNTVSWLKGVDGNYFLDLTLNIGFPIVSGSSTLMSKGGLCRGSISMLISRKI